MAGGDSEPLGTGSVRPGNNRAAILIVLALSLGLGACGELRPRSEHPYYLPHRVEPGETLYSIAFRYGYDYRQLAAWNEISPPYTIFPGQELIVLAPDRYEPKAEPRPRAGDPLPTGQEVEEDDAPEAEEGDAEPAVAAPAVMVPSPVAVSTGAEGSSPVPRYNGPPSKSHPSRSAGKKAQAKPAGKKPEKPEKKSGTKKKREKGTPKEADPSKRTAKRGGTAKENDKGNLAAKSSVKWQWPTQGKVRVRFAAGDGRKGIDLSGNLGQTVKAAADGEVVYSGSGLIGYGKLIIIKHDDVYLSAYGHNSRLLVKEGDKVKAGKPIAEMGQSPKTGSILHFEIRRNGKPVDPLLYLPNRES